MKTKTNLKAGSIEDSELIRARGDRSETTKSKRKGDQP
jgi:hypothetical protein